MDNKLYTSELDAQGYPITARYLNAIHKDCKILADKYKMRSEADDFLQLALTEATRLEKVFDASRGPSFMSFIRNPIKQVIQKMYGYSRSETNKFNKISKFMDGFLQEHGILPSVPTIAKALKTTSWDIQSIYYGKPIKISLDTLPPDFTITDTLVSSPSELVADLLEALSPFRSQLITAYYLEGTPLDELSSSLGMSQAVITKELAEAFKTLQHEGLSSV